MTETAVKMDMQKAFGHLKLRVVAVNFRKAKVRLWIAARLIKLASIVMCGAKIELVG
jgi:hypothetical protein